VGFREKSAETLANATLQQAVAAATARFNAARARAVAATPDWEGLREYARQVKAHTLARLDHYLEALEARVRERGGHVFWAPTGFDAASYIIGVATRLEAALVVKSKSMATEEIELNAALERVSIEPVETDLGEFIVQLARERPYHILAPALHKTRGEVRALFARHLGADSPDDIPALTRVARRVLREKFAAARVGITGANFAVAETGTIVVVENEGNARLATSLPRAHIVVMGIEKVLPRWDDLAVCLRLLPRAATGQKLTSYVSLFTGPRRPAEPDGPDEFHLVLLDNGRSRILADPRLRPTLACIRCGACLNTCPVYARAGGHAYGSVYSGPIGAVLTPQLEPAPASELPFASSLCGACGDVCPVKIPLPDLLMELRGRMAPRRAHAEGKRFWIRVWSWAMRSPVRYALVTTAARLLLRLRARDGWIHSLPGALGEWTRAREFPAPAPKPFRALWEEIRE
jgi:L-lactate dehydrogenase complex protein LldF